MIIYNNISEIIRYQRNRSGLTQPEPAHLAGVDKTVVFDIERGKDGVHWNTLNKVLRMVRIPNPVRF